MKIKKLLFFAIVALLVSSCHEMEELAYIADATRDSAVAIQGEFSKGIQPNDLLSIYVESAEPSSTIQFNQETNKIAVSSAGTVLNPGSAAVGGYLVNKEGDIIFPVLGKIHVAGFTHNELAKNIENRLVADGHIMDPHVTVRLLNFKVCVLGEVSNPGQLQVSGERISILEALSMAGDLTIYGQRENVTVIREENGQRVIGQVDLRSKDLFDSPYYYLHQNDVVYVEPNLRQKQAANRNPYITTYLTATSSVLSIISTLTLIITRFGKNN